MNRKSTTQQAVLAWIALHSHRGATYLDLFLQSQDARVKFHLKSSNRLLLFLRNCCCDIVDMVGIVVLPSKRIHSLGRSMPSVNKNSQKSHTRFTPEQTQIVSSFDKMPYDARSSTMLVRKVWWVEWGWLWQRPEHRSLLGTVALFDAR